jgi:hypothetical protein
VLEHYVQKIAAITRQARSETSLQIKLERLLSELLWDFDIRYEPSVNETLKSLGLSQVDSTRPDSLFGHVVLDYKAPHLLAAPKEFQKAKQQIEGYLDTATGADHTVECQKWAGILWDGACLAFCHSDGKKWVILTIRSGPLRCLHLAHHFSVSCPVIALR